MQTFVGLFETVQLSKVELWHYEICAALIDNRWEKFWNILGFQFHFKNELIK